MRTVSRGPEPLILALFRLIEPNATWSSGGRAVLHKAITESLAAGQHGMCAYCERRLPDRRCVEHVHPRNSPVCAHRPVGHYDWENLLAVCGSDTSCDGSQGKGGKHLCGEILFPDEAGVPTGRLVDVNPATGRLMPRSGLTAPTRELVTKSLDQLNLNCEELKEMRKQLLRVADDSLEAGDEPDLIRFELYGRGFASTIDSFLNVP